MEVENVFRNSLAKTVAFARMIFVFLDTTSS